MKIISSIVLFTSFVSFTHLHADELSEEALNALKLEKLQAESMIAKLQKMGRLNKNEVVKAKREIASVQEEGMDEIKNEAIERLASKNSLATK